MKKETKNLKVTISIRGGMVIDVDAPDNVDVYVRDYDTPLIMESYMDEKKAEICRNKMDMDEDGDLYINEIW